MSLSFTLRYFLFVGLYCNSNGVTSVALRRPRRRVAAAPRFQMLSIHTPQVCVGILNMWGLPALLLSSKRASGELRTYREEQSNEHKTCDSITGRGPDLTVHIVKKI